MVVPTAAEGGPYAEIFATPPACDDDLRCYADYLNLLHLCSGEGQTPMRDA